MYCFEREWCKISLEIFAFCWFFGGRVRLWSVVVLWIKRQHRGQHRGVFLAVPRFSSEFQEKFTNGSNYNEITSRKPWGDFVMCVKTSWNVCSVNRTTSRVRLLRGERADSQKSEKKVFGTMFSKVVTTFPWAFLDDFITFITFNVGPAVACTRCYRLIHSRSTV